MNIMMNPATMEEQWGKKEAKLVLLLPISTIKWNLLSDVSVGALKNAQGYTIFSLPCVQSTQQPASQARTKD